MKKTFLNIVLLSWTIFSYAATDGEQNQTIQGEDKIISYFTTTLKEGTAKSFDGDLETTQYDIEQMCDNIWGLWKKAVEQYEEEKLIEPNDLNNRKVGYWTLPSELEPNATMPYYFGMNGDVPANEKAPMFLYMHGSGDKDIEWENGIGFSLKRFYNPAAYFIPQIPNTGEYYRWAIQSKQWAWEKLLRLAFLNEKIDANRIYFFGISEGGYGSQRLASFYADYLAGVGPMAGGEPLKNAPMENAANIAFSLRTGTEDYGFGRNFLTQTAQQVADSLANAHPGYYNHYIELIPNAGHSIDYTPTTPWLAKYTRNPHPKYFYWENYEMYGRKRNGFYNLRINSEKKLIPTWRNCYEMKIEGNTVYLNINSVAYTTTMTQSGIEMLFSKKFYKTTLGNVTLFLNDKLVDLNKPVKIIVNNEELFNGMVSPSIKAMVESCALFFDPERVFPVAIDIDLGSKTVTGIKEITKENSNPNVYGLNGTAINSPTGKGVYIIEGKKVLFK